MHGKGNCPIYPSGQTPHAYHEPLLNRYMTFMYLQIKVYKCNQGWGQPFLSYPSLVSHPEFMYVHCEKKRVSLTKLWSPHLQPSSHLHLVIKECAHKCNQYFDPISSPDPIAVNIVSLCHAAKLCNRQSSNTTLINCKIG